MSNPTASVTPPPGSPTDPQVTTDTAAEPHAGHRISAAQVERQAASVGAIAAGVLLIVAGAVQILEGISAVETDSVIVIGPEYTYQWDPVGWGVVHIVIGALLLAVAAALFTGQTWARLSAIVIAALSIVANFLWLPHNPWWSVLIIALDAYLIWALATWHRHSGNAPTTTEAHL